MYKKCFRSTHNLLSGIYVPHWLFTPYQNPILAESMRISRQKTPIDDMADEGNHHPESTTNTRPTKR